MIVVNSGRNWVLIQFVRRKQAAPDVAFGDDDNEEPVVAVVRVHSPRRAYPLHRFRKDRLLAYRRDAIISLSVQFGKLRIVREFSTRGAEPRVLNRVEEKEDALALAQMPRYWKREGVGGMGRQVAFSSVVVQADRLSQPCGFLSVRMVLCRSNGKDERLRIDDDLVVKLDGIVQVALFFRLIDLDELILFAEELERFIFLNAAVHLRIGVGEDHVESFREQLAKEPGRRREIVGFA